MATSTTHYGLAKPDGDELIDLSVLNGNMDIIDSTMYGLETDKLSKSGGSVSGSIEVMADDITRDTAPSSNTYADERYALVDSQGELIGYVRALSKSNGNEGVQLETIRTVGETEVNHALQLEIDSSGNRKVIVHDGAAWRSGIGAISTSGDTMTGQLRLKQSAINRDAANPSSDQWGDRYLVNVDADGETIANLRSVRRSGGRMDTFVYVYNEDGSGNEISNNIRVGIAKNGSREWQVGGAGYIDGGHVQVQGIASPSFIAKDPNVDLSKTNNNLSSGSRYPAWYSADSAGRISARMENVVSSDGSNGFYLYARQYNTSGDNTQQKGIKYTIAKGGTGTWNIADGSSFRSAISAAAGDLETIDYNPSNYGYIYSWWEARRMGKVCTLKINGFKNIPNQSNFTVFTLPASFKPRLEYAMDICDPYSQTTGGTTCVRLFVRTDGKVTGYKYGGSAVDNLCGTLTWLTA